MSHHCLQLLSAANAEIISKLDTPNEIQLFIDQEIIYDPNREDRSVTEVLHDGQAECFNGALLTATCLLVAGYEPSLIKLEARGGDEEHILCLFKENGYYGSIAQSKYLGLKGRQPIYSSVRDLVVSYQELYFGFDGRYTLMGYREPVLLKSFDFGWINNSEVVRNVDAEINKSELNRQIK